MKKSASTYVYLTQRWAWGSQRWPFKVQILVRCNFRVLISMRSPWFMWSKVAVLCAIEWIAYYRWTPCICTIFAHSAGCLEFIFSSFAFLNFLYIFSKRSSLREGKSRQQPSPQASLPLVPASHPKSLPHFLFVHCGPENLLLPSEISTSIFAPIHYETQISSSALRENFILISVFLGKTVTNGGKVWAAKYFVFVSRARLNEIISSNSGYRLLVGGGEGRRDRDE